MSEFVKTDEAAEQLDEPCAVWHDYYFGNGERKFDPTRVLVSHDGIELRRDYRHGTTEQLTALTRGAVSPDEVTPPADLLDWRTWPAFVAAAPPRPAGSPPDFVARGQNPYLGSEDTLRVTRRRRYPWTYCDAVCHGRRRTLDIENDYGDGGGLLFETSWKGEFERLIARVARASKLNLREQNCRETGKAKTILGETCRYIELEEFAVGGRWITVDGIPLETDEEARSGRFSWRAIELERRSPEFSEVMPPAEILDPAKWGLTR
jgi:hypothetical protein